MYKFEIFQQKIIYPNDDDGTKLNDKSCPRSRSGHRMVKVGCHLYLFGGYNPSIAVNEYDDETWQEHSPLFKELWKFNLFNQKWTRLETLDEMPNELASHSAVNYGPYIIIYGGTANPFGRSSSNSVHLCNVQNKKWKMIHTSGAKPQPMYGQAICRSGDNLYVVGGTKGFEYSLDVHRLDLKLMHWKNLTAKYINPNSVRERCRHEIIEHNGYIFVFAGGTSEENFDLEYLPTFDINSQSWHLTSTHHDVYGVPKPRKCHQIVRHKNFVFVHGGTNDQTQMGDLWRLDMDSMQWRRVIKSTHHKKLYFHSTSVTEDGCIYIFGGLKSGSTNRTNEISKIWIDIPPLQAMAWEAMMHYAPKLDTYSSSHLLELGIPSFFVKALSIKQSDGG